MKNALLFLLFLALTSCQVTETIEINEDGSGRIQTDELRDENTYMQIAGDNYAKEEKFVETDYHFEDIIKKYAENFGKLTEFEKNTFNRYNDVYVHVKNNSYEKEFRTTIYQDFKKPEDIADLYKTDEYEDDLRNNYALSAEEHYYSINYSFVDDVFKRKVKITSQAFLKKKSDEIEEFKKQFAKIKVNQPYVLKYTFAKPIKSVSNPKAKLSLDKKSMTLNFLISDCMQNPEITNLEIVLEK
jgi:hypothetical protein